MGFRSTRVRNRQPEYTEKKDSTKYCLYSQRTQAFLFLSYTPVMVLDTKNGIPTSDAAGYELNGAESIELGSAISDKKIRVANLPKRTTLKTTNLKGCLLNYNSTSF
nr:MAG TPA: hypothetical protein [Caudoviricetes sp.]